MARTVQTKIRRTWIRRITVSVYGNFDRICIRMTVHGFWPTVYIRRMYNQTVYAPDISYPDGLYLQVVQGLIPSNSSPFCFFWSIFFSRASPY